MPTVDTSPRALVIDGRKELITAGCIHYWRSTPEMWPHLLQRSREAGINTIQTYVFWGVHEKQQGKLDFTGRYNLPAFCQAVHDAGMNLIVRVGPYICAEVNYGGFPAWLRDVPGIRFRTWNQSFMQAMERWIRELGERIRPFSAANGGPLILAEIENEYNALVPIYGDEGLRYMQWAIDLGRSLDLGIPWLTCTPVENALPTIHGFTGWKEVESFCPENPEVPPLWTEHWPGWTNTFGHARRLRSPEAVAYGAARFFAEGGAGISYFMWHAGTNFDREGMFLQCPDYGFGAPVDEYGWLSTKGKHLARLHEVLHANRECLLEGDWRRNVLETEVSVCSYENGEDAVHFLNNDTAYEKQTEWAGATMNLLPQSTAILTNRGDVLFDSGRVQREDCVSQNYMTAIAFEDGFYAQSESVPTAESREPAAVLAEPKEQLQWTKDETDYCWYVADVDFESGGAGILSLTRVADVAYVFIDGELMAHTEGPLAEDRGHPESPAFMQQFNVPMTKGRHQLAILCCGVGLVKHDCMLNMANMAEERKGLWGAVLWKGDQIEAEWRVYPGLAGENNAWYNGDGQWPSTQSADENGLPCWWEGRFSRPAESGPFALDLNGMGKGLAWVNGFCLGRYWQIPNVGHLVHGFVAEDTERGEVGVLTQRYYHIPEAWLGENNALVLVEEQGANPNTAGVRICKVAYDTSDA